MVATSQPLAAEAGLEILKKGGNAVDAAIATAACLTVVEPTSNGIGGDAFALVWMKDKLHGLNASGPAPGLLSLETLKSLKLDEIPKFGWVPVTVPGTPAAWAELSKRFGALSLLECLEPAIRYAKEGYPVSPTLAKNWKRAVQIFKKALTEPVFEAWFQTFAPDGDAPTAGRIWSSPTHAETLKRIGETNSRTFYTGEIADAIDAHAQATGGFVRKTDLEQFRVEWVDPIQVSYKGFDVWEIPPNGQGIVALMALKTLEKDTFSHRDEVACWHHQIESIKLAFADAKQHLADSRAMRVSVESMLHSDYATKRRSQINPDYAQCYNSGLPDRGGTVYLATADRFGNMVSYIQSNYMGFGSGVVVPGTGIALHNRGHNFNVIPGHPNCIEPGKRPFHTIIPGFLTKNGHAIGPFGVMGGFMQPQGHLQMMMNTIDFGMNPQEAIDAPRWQWMEGQTVWVEPSTPLHLVDALSAMGHDIRIQHEIGQFGRAQAIWLQEDGVLCGGTEGRTDGHIAVW